MPRVGLTSELSSTPSEFSTAVLKESISAVTCGSVHMPDVFGIPGAWVTVTPGRGVTAAGVTVNGKGTAGFESDEVGVTGGGVGVAGEAQPVNRANPRNRIDRVLMLMLISSFDNYIPPP